MYVPRPSRDYPFMVLIVYEGKLTLSQRYGFHATLTAGYRSQSRAERRLQHSTTSSQTRRRGNGPATNGPCFVPQLEHTPVGRLKMLPRVDFILWNLERYRLTEWVIPPEREFLPCFLDPLLFWPCAATGFSPLSDYDAKDYVLDRAVGHYHPC